MPTLKQKRLAQLVIEHAKDTNITKGKLVEMGGYGHSIQIAPEKAFNSKGFLQELDNLGLTDELLTKSLVADIKAKKKNRARELELGFKVRGRLKEQPDGNTTNNLIIVEADRTARIARRAIARISGGEESLDRLSNTDEPEV